VKKLQREHVVAASLVGTVVVVLGFASGLGQVPAGSESAAPPAAQKPPRETVPAKTTTPVPAVHIGHPIAEPPQRVAATTRPAPTTTVPPTHPHSTAPPTSTSPTTPPTSPTKPPSCDVDAITALLRQVGALVGELPVVTELTEGLVVVDEVPKLLGGLLGGLTGKNPTPVEGLLGDSCRLLVDPKTGRVTGLLDRGTP
jgi:hypothetical protein